MQELQPGLWHWTARHPDWEESEPWDSHVSSYALDDGERLLLFDPLGVPDELQARDREKVIVLTAPWHERDAQTLGFPVWSPRPDTAEDLMRQFGITREQAGDGSPDLKWLQDGNWYAAGDTLPFGIEALEGHKRNDLVLWIADRRVIVVGDTLADFGDRIAINERWLPEGRTRESVRETLLPLLELPVELVLPAHGAPTDRATLERALA
ncbi:MAG TPA: MBL fold metallo-hydrolase [Gaiellaceae bacterium]|nr:MBL fold metallo-hydrolase [Gaiellaceae bacterium]